MRKELSKHKLTAAVAFLAIYCGDFAEAGATTPHQPAINQASTNLESDPSIERIRYYHGYGYRRYGPRGDGYYGHSYYRPYRYYQPSYYGNYYDDCY